MLSKPDVARQISDLMMDIFTRVHQSVEMVQQTCSADEAARYRKATAKVVGAVVMDVLEPLYEKNPSLKPPNWDG